MKMNEYVLAGEIIFFTANWFVSIIVCSMALHGSSIPAGLASCGICLLLLDLAFMIIYSIEMIKVGGFVNLLKEYKKKNQATQIENNNQQILLQSQYTACTLPPICPPIEVAQPDSCQRKLEFDPVCSFPRFPALEVENSCQKKLQFDGLSSPVSHFQSLTPTPCNSPATFEMV